MSAHDEGGALPPDFEAAFRRLAQRPEVELVIRPVDAWLLMATLQMALRHPAFPRELGEQVTRIATRLQTLVSELEPGLAAYAQAGWDPSQDVPRTHT